MTDRRESTPAVVIPPQALLLTGEGMRAMTPERIETLSRMVGGLGLRMTPATDLPELVALAKQELAPDPIWAGRGDFRVFAQANGYTTRRADLCWVSIGFTAYSSRRKSDGLPVLRFSEEWDFGDVDLRSVNERLEASDYNTDAWQYSGSTKPEPVIEFLTRLVRDQINDQNPDGL